MTRITARLNDTIATNENLIYCATVNLTWNELSEFMKGKVTFGQPIETVEFLNRKSFTKEMLDEKCYLAYADLVGNDIVNKIVKNLKEKFDETSKIDFNSLDLKPSDILAYSFLLKILTFEKKFEALDNHLHFSGELVDAFGIKKVGSDTEKKLKNQVYVLHYKNQDDFSISLRTQSQDVIILVKTPTADTIENIIKLNETLIEASLKDSLERPEFRLQKNESLIIPKIEFDLEHHFKEMIGQDLYVDGEHANYFIADAVQFIKFVLNEEGAKLRSEMAIFAYRYMSFNESRPRQFIFDKPFLIYLKEKDSPLYFAAWVANTEILKKIK
jgi:hypothetical protein